MSTATSKFKFITLYVVSIILVGVIMAAMWKPKAVPATSVPVAAEKSSEEKRLTTVDDALLKKFTQLQQQHNNWLMLKSGAPDSARSYQAGVNLVNSEKEFQNMLDSLAQEEKNYHDADNIMRLKSSVSAFRLALNNQIATRNIRAIANSNKTAGVREKQLIAQLQSDLQERENQVSALQNELKVQSKASTNSLPPNVAKLVQENKFLSASLSDQVNKNAVIIQANKVLTQKVDKLNKQVDAFRKFTGSE